MTSDLRVRANEGDPDSMFALANRIHCGDSNEGIESNHQEAFIWLQRAADAGHTEAMLAVAFCFAHGDGINQDNAMAATYFRRAAQSGEPGPMLTLGQLHRRGVFVEKSFIEAYYWLRRAADVGNVHAMFELGVLLCDGSNVAVRDVDEGTRLLRSAANAGNVNAMREMARISLPDPDAVTEWLQRAADGGDAVCAKLLAEKPAAAKSMTNDIMSDDVAKQLSAVRQWRSLLAGADDSHAIPASIFPLLPRLVILLQSENEKVQFEAACVLTNVASGPPAATQAVFDAGAIPALALLLRSTHEVVREQAIWALGNMFGDSPRSRDVFLAQGALASLLDCFGDLSRKSLVSTAAWTLSLLCRGTPPADVVVPALAALLVVDDPEVQSNACWALVYLTSTANERLETVACVLRGVQPLLRHAAAAVCEPALRFVSNIVRGGQTHVQAVIDAQMIPILVQAVTAAPSRAAKRTALAVLSSATSVCSLTQAHHFVQHGAFGAFVGAPAGSTGVAQALDGIENLLRIASDVDGKPIRDNFVESGCVNYLEALATQQRHAERARAMLARLSH